MPFTDLTKKEKEDLIDFLSYFDKSSFVKSGFGTGDMEFIFNNDTNFACSKKQKQNIINALNKII